MILYSSGIYLQDETATEENGEVATPLPQDIIVINGKKELAEEASAALKALVPITREMEIPFEFHRYIIGQKGMLQAAVVYTL